VRRGQRTSTGSRRRAWCRWSPAWPGRAAGVGRRTRGEQHLFPRREVAWSTPSQAPDALLQGPGVGSRTSVGAVPRPPRWRGAVGVSRVVGSSTGIGRRACGQGVDRGEQFPWTRSPAHRRRGLEPRPHGNSAHPDRPPDGKPGARSGRRPLQPLLHPDGATPSWWPRDCADSTSATPHWPGEEHPGALRRVDHATSPPTEGDAALLRVLRQLLRLDLPSWRPRPMPSAAPRRRPPVPRRHRVPRRTRANGVSVIDWRR